MNYAEPAGIALFVLALALALAVAALVMAIKTNALKKKFFAGKQAASLEEFILNQNKKINELAKQSEYIEEALHGLREVQKSSIQKIGLHRYNPFADDGGNLSFSLAILDGSGNGMVITSMHGREANRIYAKPVVKGTSEYKLTEEEQKAIAQSK
jgi:uncharacterized protein YlxW (UPF0749 family)